LYSDNELNQLPSITYNDASSREFLSILYHLKDRLFQTKSWILRLAPQGPAEHQYSLIIFGTYFLPKLRKLSPNYRHSFFIQTHSKLLGGKSGANVTQLITRLSAKRILGATTQLAPTDTQFTYRFLMSSFTDHTLFSFQDQQYTATFSFQENSSTTSSPGTLDLGTFTFGCLPCVSAGE
jgi:hypothetical protein